MVEEKEINIDPQQNEKFLKIWNQINDSIGRLNELTKSVPTIDEVMDTSNTKN